MPQLHSVLSQEYDIIHLINDSNKNVLGGWDSPLRDRNKVIYHL